MKINPASSGSLSLSKAWNREHNEIQKIALSQHACVWKTYLEYAGADLNRWNRIISQAIV